MSHARTTHSLYFHIARNSPLPSLPFFGQQEYLQAASQDHGAQLPQAKSTVALTNVVFTEQETLCSHFRVKYLLFISAKARERKEQKGKKKAGGEKVRLIKTDRQRERGGIKPSGCGDIVRRSMTTELEDSVPFRPMLL